MDKLHRKLLSKVVPGCLLALTATIANSGAMGPVAVEPAGKIYLGVFGVVAD